LNLPVLATNGGRYATAYDREVLDLFTTIRHHTQLDHAGRLLERLAMRLPVSTQARRCLNRAVDRR